MNSIEILEKNTNSSRHDSNCFFVLCISFSFFFFIIILLFSGVQFSFFGRSCCFSFSCFWWCCLLSHPLGGASFPITSVEWWSPCKLLFFLFLLVGLFFPHFSIGGAAAWFLPLAFFFSPSARCLVSKLWGCPRFFGQRRRPPATDVDQRNVVQPHTWV